MKFALTEYEDMCNVKHIKIWHAFDFSFYLIFKFIYIYRPKLQKCPTARKKFFRILLENEVMSILLLVMVQTRVESGIQSLVGYY